MSEELQPDRCARLLKAIADTDRLRIIDLLREGPLAVTDLANRLELQVVNASHHLGVLRHAGLVLDERQGRFVVYQLNPEVFQPTRREGQAEFLNLGCCRLEIPKS